MTTPLRQQMMDDVLEGRPVSSFEIIDGHCHMGYYHNFNIPMRTAADMVRLMDLAGIRCCVASAHAGIGPDFRLGNDQIIQAMKEFPERIYGYCTVNPNYAAQEMQDELERCFEAGMVAVKLHPNLHSYPVDGEGYLPAWESANERRVCVLSHTSVGDRTCEIRTFDKLAADFPNVKILLGHSGFGYEGAKQSCELARKHENVYLDVAGSVVYRGLIERMVEGAGADKVLFGTDLPFIDCRPQVGRFAFTKLNDEQLALTLGGNARRLFGI